VSVAKNAMRSVVFFAADRTPEESFKDTFSVCIKKSCLRRQPFWRH
jgi:hypothetical protein